MKRYSHLIIAFICLFSGCVDRFDDMNTNPGAVTEASLKYILPYIQEVGSHLNCDPYQRADNLYAQMYCQYFANTLADFASDRYGYNDSWSENGFWLPYYSTLKHAKVAKETALNNPEQNNIYQMIRIIEACFTGGMTDVFGDIPYSEAALGNTQNSYDTQESIYNDMFNELKEAVSVLVENNTDQETCTSDNDLIFSGDIQKWIRFANSLRLRYALRISYINPDLAKEEGEAALAAGVMLSNDDNAYVTASATSSKGWGHPLYMMSTWGGFTMSKTMEDILKNESTVVDPRMKLWFGQAADYVTAVSNGEAALQEYIAGGGEQYSGLPNGMSTTEIGLAVNSASRHSQCWGLQAYPDWNSQSTPSLDVLNLTVTLPLKLMTYGEVCFMKAEAALRGWSGAGDVQTNYETGIVASLEDERSHLSDVTLSSSDDDLTYLTTGKVAWNDADTEEAKLEKIATQRWLSLYPNGIEAWAECRRTGYPKLIPVRHSDDENINPSNGDFIKKLRYTDSERRENAENSMASTLNQGQGDTSTTLVWWDTDRQKQVGYRAINSINVVK